jgi:ATP phosphoribosyltransferase regulatory subunit
MFKLYDREGDTVTLRSDLTPPIARVVAAHYGESRLPVRLSYVENAFRRSASLQGKLKEFTQAGVELFGPTGAHADAEVVALAVECLQAARLSGFRIDIGQVDFIKGALEETALPGDVCRKLFGLMVSRDFASVRETVDPLSIPAGVKTLLSELPTFIGGAQVIERARSLTKSARAQKALTDLEAVFALLREWGVSESVSFDLCMIGHWDYYTGMIFSGYARGAGTSLLDGGRYDTLSSAFGKDIPAVGFALKVNALTDALHANKQPPERALSGTFAAFTKQAAPAAAEMIARLRKDGVPIVNGFGMPTREQAIETAKRKTMAGVIFFGSGGIDAIDVIDIKTGQIKTATKTQLLNNLTP